jgi:hypothetical protein
MSEEIKDSKVIGKRTFGKTTRKRHGARKQNGENAQCEEGEAKGTGEVNFEGCKQIRTRHVGLLLQVCVLVASRTSGESSATIIVGLVTRGAACVASMMLARDKQAPEELILTQPSGSTVAVEVVDLRRLVSLFPFAAVRRRHIHPWWWLDGAVREIVCRFVVLEWVCRAN